MQKQQLRAAFFCPKDSGTVLGADDGVSGASAHGADTESLGPCGLWVVTDERTEAKQLHDQWGKEHEQQREAKVGVQILQVVGGLQLQVHGAVREEHEQCS